MKRWLRSIVIGAALLASPGWAHHSGAMFDHSKLVKIQGTVVSWQWSNPHSWLKLATPDGKGGTVVQNFETGSPNTMYRDGWRINSFKPGDKVTVVAFPRKDTPVNGMMVTGTTAAGITLTWLPAGATAGAVLVNR
jgi:hypothetical protein